MNTMILTLYIGKIASLANPPFELFNDTIQAVVFGELGRLKIAEGLTAYNANGVYIDNKDNIQHENTLVIKVITFSDKVDMDAVKQLKATLETKLYQNDILVTITTETIL